jgi:Adenylate and Guanylate cyclase catalytic domain
MSACAVVTLPTEAPLIGASDGLTAREVVERFKGHIAQYLGDGLLVYFGYPLTHEDDALRAVRTGLGMVEGMERLNTCLQRERGIRLGVRLGIHTGLVVAGDTSELPILGELNLAARLKELTEPGTIIISSATYRLVQRRFHCQALGSHSLGGVCQPVVVYRVLKEQEDQYELTPLVGRQQEMGLLLEHWAQMEDQNSAFYPVAVGRPYFLTLLAEVYGRGGQAEEGLSMPCVH